MKRVIIAAACLALSACGDNPGDDAAQAACRAYGTSPTTTAENAELRAEASERAQRAAEADDAYAALPKDMTDAWSRADAWADAQNAGQPVTGAEVDAYFASDRRVRADCADAGNDIGPLRP